LKCHIHTDRLLVQEEDGLAVQQENSFIVQKKIVLAQEEHLLLAQEEDILHMQGEDPPLVQEQHFVLYKKKIQITILFFASCFDAKGYHLPALQANALKKNAAAAICKKPSGNFVLPVASLPRAPAAKANPPTLCLQFAVRFRGRWPPPSSFACMACLPGR
jgi:hypothetical protein